MSPEKNSKIVAEFRQSNRKLCNGLAKLSQEELLGRLIVELAGKQHQIQADLDRVNLAAEECPMILRVLKNDPNKTT